MIDRLELEIVPDNSTRSGALQNDEVDVTYGLNTEDLDEYDDSDDYVVDSIEAGGYEYIQYPMNVEPWDDERHTCRELTYRRDRRVFPPSQTSTRSRSTTTPSVVSGSPTSRPRQTAAPSGV